MMGMRVVGMCTANASLSKASCPFIPSVCIVACPVFLLLGARLGTLLFSGLDADRSGEALVMRGLLATVPTACGGGFGARGLTAMARISSRVLRGDGTSFGGGVGGESMVVGVCEWKRRWKIILDCRYVFADMTTIIAQFWYSESLPYS